MKNFKVGDFFECYFKAGRSCDEFGHATPYWTAFVQYKKEGQKVKIWVAQTLGTGTVSNTMTSQEENTSYDKILETLKYFRWLENHYKKVYEI